MTGMRGYVIGFGLSLVFTLAAYALVANRAQSPGSGLPENLLIAIIVFLALVQLAAQLIFFLHLKKESKPRWNFMALSFAAIVVVTVVFGSLWIMQNLDYHHSPPSTIDEAIIRDEGIE